MQVAEVRRITRARRLFVTERGLTGERGGENNTVTSFRLRSAPDTQHMRIVNDRRLRRTRPPLKKPPHLHPPAGPAGASGATHVGACVCVRVAVVVNASAVLQVANILRLHLPPQPPNKVQSTCVFGYRVTFVNACSAPVWRSHSAHPRMYVWMSLHIDLLAARLVLCGALSSSRGRRGPADVHAPTRGLRNYIISDPTGSYACFPCLALRTSSYSWCWGASLEWSRGSHRSFFVLNP